jgi:hypothetical protein
MLSQKSSSCGNVASILVLDEHLAQEYKVFHHAPVVSHPLSFPYQDPIAYHRTGRQVCAGETPSRRLLFVVQYSVWIPNAQLISHT